MRAGILILFATIAIAAATEQKVQNTRYDRPGAYKPAVVPERNQYGGHKPVVLPAPIRVTHRPQTLPAQVPYRPSGGSHGNNRGPSFNPGELGKPYNPPGHGNTRPGTVFRPNEHAKPYNPDQQREQQPYRG